MIDDKHEPGWSSLAAAIVEQAAKDYKDSFLGYEIEKNGPGRESVMAECERFFKSQWARELATLSTNQEVEHIELTAIREQIDGIYQFLSRKGNGQIKLFWKKGKQTMSHTLPPSLIEELEEPLREILEILAQGESDLIKKIRHEE